ncbi:putative periplasmic protein TrxB [Methylophaga frappieri]|uniref:Putative periplasmic protein TrxB n=1 Tax=Methylophaga frappieri (strain ATCC BAA-2434 / DSM 25690 / JAM7) TaxID=754477 RepID=I1YFU9_METFJ|nr:FAD-dependent oxidoreductase [Methylophaga frappieri]AFJ01792.1 putative periplasmic protein TrxB [Methylophaga frappieri]
MKYDVIIIGAGAAGFGCALTLGSANDNFEWAKDRKYLILDNDRSDMKVARYNNVTGVEQGINGIDLLTKLKDQLKKYPACELKHETVTKIVRHGDEFMVEAKTGNYQASIIVLATGLNKFDIECAGVVVKENTFVPKPNLIYLENTNNVISENLYVAGLASGVPTMFSCASGDGAKVACDIFYKWAGKVAVVHDTKKTA